MCAITGIFDYRIRLSASRREVMLKDMMEASYRRSPQAGYWQDAALGIALGNKPESDVSGRYTVVFGGEIYNREALQLALAGREITLRDGGDAELFLQLVLSLGVEEALKRIHGAFSLMLWDRAEKSLTLIRDALGSKPLYVGWAGDMLLVASELKAIKSCPEFAVRVAQNSLAQYFHSGFVPAPYSIFENVWQVPAGCMLTLNAETLLPFEDLSQKIRPYWLLSEQVSASAEQRQSPLSDAEALRQFDSLMRETVAERLDTQKGSLGVLMSGGVNSTLIAAIMQAVSPHKIKSFSLGYTDLRFNEAGLAAEIARHLGSDHKTLMVDEKAALAAVNTMHDIYDEPFADVSQISAHLLSQEAGKYIAVGVSGDGADEIFGSYRRHYSAEEAARSARYMPAFLRHTLADGLESVRRAFNNTPFKSAVKNAKLEAWLETLHATSQFDIYLRHTSLWPADALPLKAGLSAQMPTARFVEQMSNISELEKSVLHDALFYLPNAVLARNERTTTLAGLHVRSPYIDRKIVEFAWQLPQDMKFREGKSKWLLDQLLGRYVPRPYFDRHKRSYAAPVNDWLRGPLRGWAETHLSEYALSRDGLLNPAPIRRMWEQHLGGRVDHGQSLWTVLMYQTWKEKWLGS